MHYVKYVIQTFLHIEQRHLSKAIVLRVFKHNPLTVTVVWVGNIIIAHDQAFLFLMPFFHLLYPFGIKIVL